MKTKISSFAEFGLPHPLQKTLHQIQFTKPTPIQSESIPPALEGRDILGIAQTGTGKTGAFGIPFLTQLYSDPNRAGLVLVPTRELAAQVGQVLRQMSKKLKLHGVKIVGGEPFNRQVRELERSYDFIVATPGRLNDHIKEGTVDLRDVGFLVLDEMDRMLDMGFAPQIRQIVQHVNRSRQTFLFSATFPKEISKLAFGMMKDPVRIDIAPTKKAAKVDEKSYQTTPKEKSRLILDVMNKEPGKTLIFTRTKSRTEKVARVLGKSGFRVVNLHGGRSQGQRKRALDMFRKGSHPVMVATDVAGRGIDVSDIERVVNYDLPQCHDDYIHRIGRTARNGRSGLAVNFVTEEDTDAETILTGKKPEQRRRSQKRSGPRGKKRPSRHQRGPKRFGRKGKRR